MIFLTRFAPSPTGLLHLGHAYSALTAARAAHEAGGRFLLRIEDIDQTRCRPGYAAAIEQDLSWLGLTWETPVRRQSEHLADYAGALDTLRAKGVVYRCFLTRRELADAAMSAPHSDDNTLIYRGPAQRMSTDEEEARIARGDSYAWRLSMKCSQDLLGEKFARLVFEEQNMGPNGEHGVIRAHPDSLGDVILARKDTPTSYHLSTTHDDAMQRVSHVIRGQDLFASTHVHVLLHCLMGWPTPLYRHHGLLAGPDGKRYAKREQSLTLAALRADGVTPEEIRRRIGLA